MSKVSRAKGPYIPPPYELADVAAIQAMHRGEATPDQQMRAIKWLIEKAAGTYEFNYYPTDRDTSFALGRSFVGQQIVKLLRLNVTSLRRLENVDSSKPTE
jgi:hypothetical protein